MFEKYFTMNEERTANKNQYSVNVLGEFAQLVS